MDSPRNFGAVGDEGSGYRPLDSPVREWSGGAALGRSRKSPRRQRSPPPLCLRLVHSGLRGRRLTEWGCGRRLGERGRGRRLGKRRTARSLCRGAGAGGPRLHLPGRYRPRNSPGTEFRRAVVRTGDQGSAVAAGIIDERPILVMILIVENMERLLRACAGNPNDSAAAERLVLCSCLR